MEREGGGIIYYLFDLIKKFSCMIFSSIKLVEWLIFLFEEGSIGVGWLVDFLAMLITKSVIFILDWLIDWLIDID